MKEKRPILILLLLASLLRLTGIATFSPPGLAHDEVANWLIDRSILDFGNHAVYFTAAYGHEAGFHYWQSLFVALIGNHALALRLPAAFAGLLGLASSYQLSRKLFGRSVALPATALLAMLIWPIFYSRLGLRAISLPLCSALSFYFFWDGWEKEETNGRLSFLLAAFWAALSLYTYMAARAVPIFYLLFFLYLLLFHRPKLYRQRLNLLSFTTLFLILATPLTYYLLTHPAAEFRISEVNYPLEALKAGNLLPVLENGWLIGRSFIWQGDPLWRQNIAFAPIFDPITAVAFYLGVAYACFNWKKPIYAALLLWLATALLPSLVTINAPSNIRMINLLPILTIFPILTFRQLLPYLPQKSPLFLFMTLIGFHLIYSSYMIGIVWPHNDEIQFVWQADLQQIGESLRQDPNQTAAIGGWTPETMDLPTLSLITGTQANQFRYFHPQKGIILPTDTPSQLFHPNKLPLHPTLQTQLHLWQPIFSITPNYTQYQFTARPEPTPQYPYRVTFSQELTFLGYDLIHQIENEWELLTYWQVAQPTAEPRSIFLHLLDQEGALIAQNDGLGSPSRFWQQGDLLLEHHLLLIPPDTIPDSLYLGVYNPTTGQRLPTDTESDTLLLPLP